MGLSWALKRTNTGVTAGCLTLKLPGLGCRLTASSRRAAGGACGQVGTPLRTRRATRTSVSHPVAHRAAPPTCSPATSVEGGSIHTFRFSQCHDPVALCYLSLQGCILEVPMPDRVPQGKGSRDRTRDREAYDANFDAIRWPTRDHASPTGDEQGKRSAGRTQGKHQIGSESR